MEEACQLINDIPVEAKLEVFKSQVSRIYRKLSWLKILGKAVSAGGLSKRYDEVGDLVVKIILRKNINSKIARLCKIEEEIDKWLNILIEKVADQIRAIGKRRLKIEKISQYLMLTTKETIEVISILSLRGKIKISVTT